MKRRIAHNYLYHIAVDASIPLPEALQAVFPNRYSVNSRWWGTRDAMFWVARDSDGTYVTIQQMHKGDGDGISWAGLTADEILAAGIAHTLNPQNVAVATNEGDPS